MIRNITDDDIRNFINNRPHVFILGAGASKAALPHGDRNGMECPVMDGFLKKTGLEGLLLNTPFQNLTDNLEIIYSAIHESGEYPEKLSALEKGVQEYFNKLTLPDTPTVYDYLLLSLRSKDCIFTFNWDDLLVQAYLRVRKITNNLPKIFFLHGNIAMGYCENCATVVLKSEKTCPKCKNKILSQPLLYPIREKNYQFNPSISNAWKSFLSILKNCSILTIFGYGAPPSDAAAIESMYHAFSSTMRRYDSIEIIDIKPESQLIEEWDPFLKETNYHVKCFRSIFDSILAEFPRRSIEGYTQRYYKNWFGASGIELEKKESIWEIGNHLKPLIDREKNEDYSIL